MAEKFGRLLPFSDKLAHASQMFSDTFRWEQGCPLADVPAALGSG